MEQDLQEQACWLLLTYESGLTTRVINEIVVTWCQQLGRTLQEFFAVDSQVWSDTCHLSAPIVEKLEQARAKLVGQAFLIEQLNHDHIHLLTVLDDNYPHLLKTSLKREQTPPVLFYTGDLRILERQTIAIIGSRKAGDSRAMERNKVVTGLAQIVIVAESDTEGGTWAGATGALRQNRPLYVRDTASSSALPGNKALIELGGHPLPWPTEQLADVLSPLIQKSAALRQEKSDTPSRPDQLSLFVGSGE